MLPPGITDDQAVAVFDQQLGALKKRLDTGEQIIALCDQGMKSLNTAPASTLMNISDVVNAMRHALLCLLEANSLANRLSLAELREQCESLEKARQQRASKVHLGGFIPPATAPRR